MSSSQARLGEVSVSARTVSLIVSSQHVQGPAYGHDAIFDLNSMQPYNLESLYEPFAEICKEIVLFLPRTSDLNQLAQIAEPNRQIQAIQYCMQGASKVSSDPTESSYTRLMVYPGTVCILRRSCKR